MPYTYGTKIISWKIYIPIIFIFSKYQKYFLKTIRTSNSNFIISVTFFTLAL